MIDKSKIKIGDQVKARYTVGSTVWETPEWVIVTDIQMVWRLMPSVEILEHKPDTSEYDTAMADALKRITDAKAVIVAAEKAYNEAQASKQIALVETRGVGARVKVIESLKYYLHSGKTGTIKSLTKYNGTPYAVVTFDHNSSTCDYPIADLIFLD